MANECNRAERRALHLAQVEISIYNQTSKLGASLPFTHLNGSPFICMGNWNKVLEVTEMCITHGVLTLAYLKLCLQLTLQR